MDKRAPEASLYSVAEDLLRLMRGYVEDEPAYEREKLTAPIDVAIKLDTGEWTWREGRDERLRVLLGCATQDDADWAGRIVLPYVNFVERRDCAAPSGRRSRRFRALTPRDVLPSDVLAAHGAQSDVEFFTLAVEWPSEPQLRLRQAYEARLPVLYALAKALEAETAAALRDVAGAVQATFSAKPVERFMAALEEEDVARPLIVVEDQVAGCIVATSPEGVAAVLSRLRGTFNVIERDRRAEPLTPAGGGYAAERLICMIPRHLGPEAWANLPDRPNTFELQVRTLFVETETRVR